MITLEQVVFWIGVVSMAVGVFRVIWVFLLTNTEWVNDVNIIEVSDDDPTEIGPEKDSIFPQRFATDESCHAQRFLIRPQNVLIKRMKLSELIYNDYDFNCKRKTVKVFKNISPYEPLLIKTELPEVVPKYELSWHGEYGAVTKYTFTSNGRSNNYNRQSGFSYEFNFIQKVRKVIGLK